jgi:hypothetical protein
VDCVTVDAHDTASSGVSSCERAVIYHAIRLSRCCPSQGTSVNIPCPYDRVKIFAFARSRPPRPADGHTLLYLAAANASSALRWRSCGANLFDGARRSCLAPPAMLHWFCAAHVRDRADDFALRRVLACRCSSRFIRIEARSHTRASMFEIRMRLAQGKEGCFVA